MAQLIPLRDNILLAASSGAFTVLEPVHVTYVRDALVRMQYPYSVWLTQRALIEPKSSGKEKRDRTVDVYAKRLKCLYDSGDGSTSESVLAAIRLAGTRTLLFDEILPAMRQIDPGWWARRPNA